MKRAAEWIKAGNVMPDLERASKPITMDPHKLDKGPRRDGRPRRGSTSMNDASY
jgi:hypothetical protein